MRASLNSLINHSSSTSSINISIAIIKVINLIITLTYMHGCPHKLSCGGGGGGGGWQATIKAPHKDKNGPPHGEKSSQKTPKGK